MTVSFIDSLNFTVKALVGATYQLAEGAILEELYYIDSQRLTHSANIAISSAASNNVPH